MTPSLNRRGDVRQVGGPVPGGRFSEHFPARSAPLDVGPRTGRGRPGNDSVEGHRGLSHRRVLTDHRSHAEQNAAIASFIRWRNARATPKTGFVTGSPIRTWIHYPAKTA